MYELSTPDITVADYLVKTLESSRVNYVFLVPGKLVYPLLASIKRSSSISGIVAAHESACGFIADGYARASQNFGVCLAIAGPGTMNLVPAMAAARADKIPVLYILGGIPSYLEGRGAFQDGTHSGIAEANVVRELANTFADIRSPFNVRSEVKRTLSGLNWMRRGTGVLSFPVDIQKKPMSSEFIDDLVGGDSGGPIMREVPAQPDAVEFLLNGFLLQSRRVAILAGSRANNPRVARTLLNVAEKFQVPVATTLSGKGTFPEDHDLALGVYGFAGHTRAIELINSNRLDVLIVLGCDLNQRDTLNWCKAMTEGKVVVSIDDDFEHVAINHPIDHVFFSGIHPTLQLLLEGEIGETAKFEQILADREEWSEVIRQLPLHDERFNDELVMEQGDGAIHPGAFIKQLRTLVPAGSSVVVDSGAHRVFMAHYWQSKGMADYFSSSTLAPMGWAVAAGIGVSLARPEFPCVVVTGDGCMLMHGTEIQTAARYQANVVYIVLNNSAHGAIHIDAVSGADMSTDFSALPQHDWAGFARALGLRASRIERMEDIALHMEQAFAAPGPYLLEVMTGIFREPNRYYADSHAAYEAALKHRAASPVHAVV
jgi:acetolactate synthase-1/2/3 large subunit